MRNTPWRRVPHLNSIACPCQRSSQLQAAAAPREVSRLHTTPAVPARDAGRSSCTGGRLVVDVLHYPLLLRWSDWYRGAHPSRFLQARAQPGDTSQLPHNAPSSATASLVLGTASRSSSGRGGGGSSSSSGGGRCHAEPKGHEATRQAAGLLSCTIAGLQAPDPAVLPLLQHCLVDTWSRGRGGGQQWPRIAQLRVFAVTAAAQQPTPAAAAQQPPAMPAASDHVGRALGAQQTAAGVEPSSSGNSSSVGSTLQEQQQQQQCSNGSASQDKVQQQVWAELWVKGLSPGALAATAAFVASRGASYNTQQQRHSITVTGSSTGSGLAALQPQAGMASNTGQLQLGTQRQQPLAAGVDGAAPVDEAPGYLQQHSTSGSWLPQRQRDAAELLLRHGLARLSDAKDIEWLGIRQSRWTAYCRAAQCAERLRLGLWAHESPTAAGLLTSAWARFRAAVARLRT